VPAGAPDVACGFDDGAAAGDWLDTAGLVFGAVDACADGSAADITAGTKTVARAAMKAAL
jgi:hypothetical protein